MNTATNAVSEGHMEQVSKATNVQQTVITGQYLYDNFVTSSAEQVTRMMIIRKWAETDHVSEAQMKEAFKSLIEKAKEADVANGVTEGRGPKVQQAMNVRTIVQNSIGALQRAPNELRALGYHETRTGYIEMGAIAAKALKTKGIKWNGKALPNDEQRAAAQAEKENQQRAILEADWKAKNPRAEGEEMYDYFKRTTEAVEALVIKTRDEEAQRKLSATCDRIVKLIGNDVDEVEKVARQLLERVDAFRKAQESGLIEGSDMSDNSETSEPESERVAA